jgi:hypothetical protein
MRTVNIELDDPNHLSREVRNMYEQWLDDRGLTMTTIVLEEQRGFFTVAESFLDVLRNSHVRFRAA